MSKNLLKINEITIIGPGLIGSSLGLALKSGISKINGIDKSMSNLDDALKNKSIDEKRTNIDKE